VGQSNQEARDRLSLLYVEELDAHCPGTVDGRLMDAFDHDRPLKDVQHSDPAKPKHWLDGKRLMNIPNDTHEFEEGFERSPPKNAEELLLATT
jgi:hypothetical protein